MIIGSNDTDLWRLVDGSLIATLSGHSKAVMSVAFSPDGKMLASGSVDNTIKLWRVADGSVITTLSGDSDSVTSIAFSPDGNTLASGSGDNTIKLWRVAGGSLITTLSGHSDKVNSVVFSPDGKTLVSGSDDKTIKLRDFFEINSKEMAQQDEVNKKEMAWQAELNNKNPQAMYLKAGQYARDGNLNKANQLYESIIKRFPDNPFAVKADDQLNASKRAERMESERQARAANEANERREAQSRAYDPCSHLYVGKVVSLKGAFGVKIDGEVRGLGGGKASVRSFNPFTKTWDNDEFSCGNL
jgi:hypothetical protein